TVVVTGQGKAGTAMEAETATDELTIYKVNDPELTIVASDSSASEPNDSGRFRITVSEAFAQDTTMNIAISGTARNGTDYTTIRQTHNFRAGRQTLDILVTVRDDSVEENSETVVVTLQDGNGYVVGSSSSATVTIKDDDELRVVPMTVEVECIADGFPFSVRTRLWTRVSNSSGKTGYIYEPHKGWKRIPSDTNRKEIDYQETNQAGKQLVERFRDSHGVVSNYFSLPADETRCHWQIGHNANGKWTHSYNGYSKIP
ncbi:Calx-beta domain-containing protein, partial [Vibrio hepatarius]|uniref:Calx-beta domain-containing protein n=1 Tax=Vibrio hepatarius TaxID=171383 RepID=UPI0025AF8BFC